MARVLITGMSGSGKSTLVHALAARGHRTVDTDYDGWVGADGRWDEPRMASLLARLPSVVVSGTVENQGLFYDRFEHIVHLHAPVDVLLARVTGRTTNPYGGTPEQRAEIVRAVVSVAPLLARTATHQLDGRRPIAELVDEVEALLLAD